MKVLHLNTYDGNGGAGRACLRLNAALQQAGVDSQVYVFYKFGHAAEVGNFSAAWWRKPFAIFNILAERFLAQWLSKKLKTPFSLQWFGRRIHQHKALKQADIIHIHWVNHGFLRPKDLKKLDLLDKPIVWTFHDSNAFTGGCHVRYTCENFHKQCGHCPILRFTGKDDFSHQNWKAKEKAYRDLNFKIVAPSKWMADSVKFSSLLGTRDVRVIANTLNTQVFKPYVKNEAKKALKINSDKFVMITGFMPSKNDKHKGTQELLSALEILARRPEIPASKIELLIFGNKPDTALPELPFKTRFLGQINSDQKLAEAYSAADVYISTSLEDNLPNTVMESLACATPVVAFETGGIPDMVKHRENGFLAKHAHAEDLAHGLAWMYHHPDAGALQKAARLSVLQNFSENIIAEKHLALYLESIKKFHA